jgi:chemotaxis methyl-accepting protein methylase
MIYFNQLLQDKVVASLIDGLVIGGILAIGSGETLEYSSAKNKLQILDKLEKIYKKKLG